jgi:hypothetical protein
MSPIGVSANNVLVRSDASNFIEQAAHGCNEKYILLLVGKLGSKKLISHCNSALPLLENHKKRVS